VAAVHAPEIGEILAAGSALGSADMIRAVGLLDATYEFPPCGASFKPLDQVRPPLRDAFECNAVDA